MLNLLNVKCPIVLSGILDSAYEHFLAFSIALSIMLESNDEVRNNFLAYAKDLMIFFVKKSKDIYGDTFTV